MVFLRRLGSENFTAVIKNIEWVWMQCNKNEHTVIEYFWKKFFLGCKDFILFYSLVQGRKGKVHGVVNAFKIHEHTHYSYKRIPFNGINAIPNSIYRMSWTENGLFEHHPYGTQLMEWMNYECFIISHILDLLEFF